MKTLPFIIFTVVFMMSANATSAEIKITNADAISETSLQSVSIPIQATPVKRLFINSKDAVLTKNFSTFSISTQAVLPTKLFITNEDAVSTGDLSSVSIPTQATPVTKLFIINEDAAQTIGLSSVSIPMTGQPPVVPPTISSFTLFLDEGLNMVSLPLKPQVSLTARSFAEKLGSTVVIRYDTEEDEFVSFVPKVFEGDGFPIEGGQGYIVNLLESKEVVFTGTAWSNAPSKSISASPSKENPHWAFVVCGAIYDGNRIAQGSANFIVTVENLRTGSVAEEKVGQLESGRYTVAFVDLGRNDVINLGDHLKVSFREDTLGITSEPVIHTVTAFDIVKGYIEVNLRMEDLVPKKSALLQNYPNPFNPDTWIPFKLAERADVTISIYDISGKLIRTLKLGDRSAGTYTTKEKAAYWDGRNNVGEKVSSGLYFYTIHASKFRSTRRMAIVK